MILHPNHQEQLNGNKMSSSKFWDKIAQRYARDKIKDMESYEKKLQATQECFTKEMNVLEVGCGTGMTATIHAPFVKHYHATDFSSGMIEIARKRAKDKMIHNISFDICDISTLPVNENSQDAVLAMNVLHLTENTNEGIQVIYKTLKTGGLFISSTACLADKMNYLKVILPLFKLIGYAPSTVNFLKRNELLLAIEKNNFAIIHEWQPSPKKGYFIIAKKL